MPYLTTDEISRYTTLPNISMEEVEVASALIDAYVGRSFDETVYIETVNLTKKRTPSGFKYRGRLTHAPITTVVGVKGYENNQFGDVVVSYDLAALRFDGQGDGYFTFLPTQSLYTTIYGQIPYELEITYKTGYVIYPENLKIACGMLVQNIKQNGGYLAWKSKSDLDYRVELVKGGLVTEGIKKIIDSIRLC